MKAAEAPVSASTIPLLMQAIGDPDSSIPGIADVVATDAGLAARVLALANSAAFGLSRQVTELQQAVSLVGGNMCQAMAVAGACNLLDDSTGLPHVRDHALRTACAARWIATRAGLDKADAFAAGLLHDLGEILLWRDDRDAYVAAHQSWDSIDDQLKGERGMYATDHALVAAEQLARWQLPGVVVNAVGDHHRPDMRYPDISTTVVTAEELVDESVEESTRFDLFKIDRADLLDIRREIFDHADEMSGVLVA